MEHKTRDNHVPISARQLVERTMGGVTSPFPWLDRSGGMEQDEAEIVRRISLVCCALPDSALQQELSIHPEGNFPTKMEELEHGA